MCFIPNVERRYCQLILIALIRPVISNYAHLRRDNSVCVCVCVGIWRALLKGDASSQCETATIRISC